jgi:hypothetical protein
VKEIKIIYIKVGEEYYVLSISLGDFCLERPSGFDLKSCKKSANKVLYYFKDVLEEKAVTVSSALEDKSLLLEFKDKYLSYASLFSDKSFIENLEEMRYATV